MPKRKAPERTENQQMQLPLDELFEQQANSDGYVHLGVTNQDIGGIQTQPAYI